MAVIWHCVVCHPSVMLAANKWEAEAGKFRPNHRHPRFWQETVCRFRDHYQLGDDASVLDVGCAKVRLGAHLPDAHARGELEEAVRGGGIYGGLLLVHCRLTDSGFRGRKMRFRFTTVVWGKEYTELFLKVVIPNQLTPGNLQHFSDHSD